MAGAPRWARVKARGVVPDLDGAGPRPKVRRGRRGWGRGGAGPGGNVKSKSRPRAWWLCGWGVGGGGSGGSAAAQSRAARRVATLMS